jgi:hypothetical protein
MRTANSLIGRSGSWTHDLVIDSTSIVSHMAASRASGLFRSNPVGVGKLFSDRAIPSRTR